MTKEAYGIENLLKSTQFIAELTDVMQVLLKDDKISFKDLLNTDLYKEAIDVLKWGQYFKDNWDDIEAEAKDLDAAEAIQLSLALMEALKTAHEVLTEGTESEG